MRRPGKLASSVLALSAALALANASTASAALLCGDFNKDTNITAPDALGALRAAVSLVECQRAVCDYTGDNLVSSRDALAILQASVGAGPDPKCPVGGCNGPDCKPTCPLDALDCCDATTCSGNGRCEVEGDFAVCTCDEEWVGATCNAEADRYPFAEKPTQQQPIWTAVGDLFVRPPSYREQMRYDLRPGTFFIANASLRDDIATGKTKATMPLVFPDGQLDVYDFDLKATYDSEIRVIDRIALEGDSKILDYVPEVKLYRTNYETDGSVRSVMQILSVDGGGFVSRGVARHDANQPKFAGVFGLAVAPLSSTMEIDVITPVNGTIEPSTVLISEAFFANTHVAGLFDDCDGLAICSDLCADTGLDQGDPGPACPPPPDPCDHVSPCGEGHGPGEPSFFHQCNDDDDNDGDGLTDESDPDCNHAASCDPGGDIPSHAHTFESGADFGMFGEVVWCTKEGDNWPSRLLDRGYNTETPFHTNTGSAAYDNLYKWGDGFYSIHEKLVRLRIIGCWRLETQDEAADCADDLAECGPFSGGDHTYPYRFGRDAAGMWDGVYADVWHARGIGLNQPLNAAHTVAGSLIGASEAASIPGWASVAGSNVAGQDASPHELAHSFNVTHCETRLVNNLWTLEGNTFQTNNCPPGDYGNHQQNRFSHAGGGVLFDCFDSGCQANPQFGDPTP